MVGLIGVGVFVIYLISVVCVGVYVRVVCLIGVYVDVFVIYLLVCVCVCARVCVPRGRSSHKSRARVKQSPKRVISVRGKLKTGVIKGKQQGRQNVVKIFPVLYLTKRHISTTA